MVRKFLVGCAALALSGAAFAQVRFNELLLNPPGTDNGTEFIELLSAAPNFSMAGLTLIGIDGDGTASGVIDVALSLSAFSTGSNGLFLWRDSATVLSPAPDSATTLNVADFSPDLENGTQTFLIVSGFTGSVGLDLDVDNNGIFDSAAPWSSVLDVFGLIEDDTAAVNNSYAAALGGFAFPQQSFSPDAFQRVGNAAYAFDALGTTPGPFVNDPLEIIDPNGVPVPVSFTMTPGSANVPEPTSLVLLALGGLLASRRRG